MYSQMGGGIHGSSVNISHEISDNINIIHVQI